MASRKSYGKSRLGKMESKAPKSMRTKMAKSSRSTANAPRTTGVANAMTRGTKSDAARSALTKVAARQTTRSAPAIGSSTPGARGVLPVGSMTPETSLSVGASPTQSALTKKPKTGTRGRGRVF